MQTYSLKQRYFLVHDRPPAQKDELLSLFKESYTLFKMRVQKLGNLEQTTTEEESEIMHLMLHGLVEAKKKLK